MFRKFFLIIIVIGFFLAAPGTRQNLFASDWFAGLSGGYLSKDYNMLLIKLILMKMTGFINTSYYFDRRKYFLLTSKSNFLYTLSFYRFYQY